MRPILTLFALIASLVSINADDGSIDFEVKNDGGLPWSPRSGAVLYCHPFNFTYLNSAHQQVTAPPNSLVMFGGDDGQSMPSNDVWLMLRNDSVVYDYHLVAGLTNSSSAPVPLDKTSFRSSMSAIHAVITPPFQKDANFTSVYISAPGPDRPDPELYVSRDAVHWESMQLFDPPPPLEHPAIVIDSAYGMWMTGGQRPSPSGSRAVSEVWSSKDGGHAWTLATIAPFPPRFSHSMVKLTGNATQAVNGKDVLVLTGGTDGITHFNDVWASADPDHLIWIRINGAASFSPRRDFALIALPQTSVVLLLGGRDTSSTFNSMFASFNGGYTWQEYGSGRKPSFSARHSMMSTLDADGHLMLGGGRNQKGLFLPELYRTRQLIDDLNLLVLAFDAELSDCGVGLYCFDSTTTFTIGARVFCSACNPKQIPLQMLIGIVCGVVSAMLCFIIYRNCYHRCKRVDTSIKEIEQREANSDAWAEHLVNEDEYDE